MFSLQILAQPSVQQRMQKNLQEQNVDGILCQEKITRYGQKVARYQAITNRTQQEQWKLDFYQRRLTFWKNWCSMLPEERR